MTSSTPDTVQSRSIKTSMPRGRFMFTDILMRLIKEKPLGLIGGIIILVLLLTGIFADLIAPYGVNDIHLADRLDAPSSQYIMGTDDVGRDIFSRIVFGARISIIVGLAGVSRNTIFVSRLRVHLQKLEQAEHARYVPSLKQQ